MTDHLSIPPTEPLTQAEVDTLAAGTPIVVQWSGGNGPFLYHVVRDKWGIVRVDNIYQTQLRRIGAWPLTRVWLA